MGKYYASPDKHRGKPLTPDTPLNPRERLFVANYIQHFDGTAAAESAGYRGKDRHSLHSTAHGLIEKPHIRAMIAKLVNLQTAALLSSPSDVLRETTWLAHSDISRCFNEDGTTLKKINEMPLEVRRCISSIRVLKQNITTGDGKTDTVVQVTFWNKVQALELLAKAHNMISGESLNRPEPVPAFVLTDTAGVRVQ